MALPIKTLTEESFAKIRDQWTGGPFQNTLEVVLLLAIENFFSGRYSVNQNLELTNYKVCAVSIIQLMSFCVTKKEGQTRDRPRHPTLQAGILPTELTDQYKCIHTGNLIITTLITCTQRILRKHKLIELTIGILQMHGHGTSGYIYGCMQPIITPSFYCYKYSSYSSFPQMTLYLSG